MAAPSALSSATSTSQASGQAKIARAYLELHQPMPARGGGAVPGGSIDTISFQFNPNELTLTKTARWVAEPARSAQTAGPPEFRGAEPGKLALEMFLDATDSMDDSVVRRVDRLFSCCVPLGDSAQQDKPVPPLVVFHWGAITSFAGYITSVSAKYSLFTMDGTPVRATCSVTLQEMAGDPTRQNPTSGGLVAQRQHRTEVGDSLASIAFREYGDPTSWRAIAALNDIDDPMRVRPGTTLLLPPAGDLRAGRR